jgi:hypothetical protein
MIGTVLQLYRILVFASLEQDVICFGRNFYKHAYLDILRLYDMLML